MTNDLELLYAAGYKSTEDGVALSGSAKQLYERWLAYLAHRLKPFYDQQIATPLFTNSATIEKAEYANHFPEQIVSAHNPAAKIQRTRIINPAACFHVYQDAQNTTLDRPFATWALATCARYENAQWQEPFRPPTFHMAELVVIGDATHVINVLAAIQETVDKSFSQLGLGGSFRPATDAFFLPQARGAKLMQQLKQLKQEYVCGYNTQYVALASVNRHETYFSDKFSIRIKAEPAHTGCVAFGLERITAYALLIWGASQANWPTELQ